MRELLAFILVLTVISPLMSQDTTGEIEAAEFIIEKEKNLTLPKASRKFRNFNFSTKTDQAPSISFEIAEPKIEIPSYQPSFTFRNLEKKSRSRYYPHKITLGFGNLVSPLLGYDFQTVNSNGKNIAINVIHESYKNGPVRGDLSGRGASRIGLFGELTGKKAILNPVINYTQNTYHFYGLTDSAFFSNSEEFLREKIFRHNLQVKTEIRSKGSDSKILFSLTPLWSIVRQSEDGGSTFNTENNVSFSGFIAGKGAGVYQPGLGISAALSEYESGNRLDRTWISANPYLWIRNEDLSVKTGIETGTYSEGGETNLFFIPDVELNYSWNDNVSLFSLIGGKVIPNRLEELTLQNEFLQDSLDLRSTLEFVNIQTGSRGTILPGFTYAASVSYSAVENQLFFVNSGSDTSRFELIYDDLDRVGLNLMLAYDFRKLFTFYANFDAYNYRLDNLEDPIHLPDVAVQLGTTVRVKEKLEINPVLSLLEGLSAVLTDDSKKDLPAVTDLGLNITYHISDQTKIFLLSRNILNQGNQRYLYYPVNSTTFKIGFSYQF